MHFVNRLPTVIVTIVIGSLTGVDLRGDDTIVLKSPMAPPGWALLERELLKANTQACEEFYQRYFDERGFLRCVTRWGGDDGPDDAIENCNDWPLLYALGAPDIVRARYRQAWEGHLRQYTEAKTVDVPLARDGMYYKEFTTMFDWMHIGEGLSVFFEMGLGDPDDAQYRRRMQRFAGFYMNEDPGAPNYDPERRLIRSFFTGSHGPLLRNATALDWAGDPIEVENRFRLGHGERTYDEMLAHFKDYTQTLGDHPQNLRATSLALSAYMLTGDEKYSRWLLDYVDAWCERTRENGNVIPSNVGRDGKIGSDANGRWDGGVYGWGFTVVVPQTGALSDRNRTMYGLVGFTNAYLMTGNDHYLDVWRKMIDAINSQRRTMNGRDVYPRMHNEKGWYGWTEQPYSEGARELYFLSQRDDDLGRVPADGWLAYLQGKNPGYPEQALRRDLDRVRQRVAAMRQDPTTPDTRLADDPMPYNPASIDSLLELVFGGLPPGSGGANLHCRFRFFDPVAPRAGLPPDVGVLIQEMTADRAVITLVNLNQLDDRKVIMQGGAYGEHDIVSVDVASKSHPIEAPWVTVKLEPGAGQQMVVTFRRYAHRPRLVFPWSAPS